MKVKGLNGREYTWKLTGYVPLKDDSKKRSSYHLAARTLLTSLFPTDRILEEVPLPGSKKLRLDFFIPAYKLAIEVQGEQHAKYSSFFHANYLAFLKSKKRDNRKREWCELNNIKLIELPYTENIDGWRERISRRREVEGTTPDGEDR